MPPRPETDSPRLQQNVAAVARLPQLLGDHPDYADLRVDEVLRLTEDRVVFLVRLGGAKAVLKLFLAPNAAEIVQKVQAEFDLMAETMADGPLQVVRCLKAEPTLGFVLLSLAPGRRMSEALRAADPAKRRRLMRQAGEWLGKYTALRRRTQTFGPRRWLQNCIDAPSAHLDPPDRQLLAALTDTLTRRNAAHSGRPVIHAATHGDFAPLNLHFHRGVMTGYDIQGEAWFAISRDAALFLGWSAVHCPPPDGPRSLGIPRADLEAFLDGGAIAPGEVATTLAFFLGAQLHRSIANPERTPDDLAQARAAVQAYLTEPIAD